MEYFLKLLLATGHFEIVDADEQSEIDFCSPIEAEDCSSLPTNIRGKRSSLN
jgi:hypothetical protein